MAVAGLSSPSRSLAARTALCAAALTLYLAALPGSTSAHISGDYKQDEFTLLRVLSIRSDDAADTIVPGCSGGNVTVNAQIVRIGGQAVACSGSLGPQNITVDGGGGNDTINLTNVTRANFSALEGDHSEGAPTDEVVGLGGPGNDTIIGGPLGESLNNLFADAEEGGDTVHGNGGDDYVRGTTDADNLFGDVGNDVIRVETGADVAHGGKGNDAIEAVIYDKQPDKFYGEAGKDQLIAGAANDLLDGGAGRDFMQGNGGKDLMYGRAGADGMDGGRGADTIFGNAGNDDISGGPGKDKIHPGSGKNKVKQ